MKGGKESHYFLHTRTKYKHGGRIMIKHTRIYPKKNRIKPDVRRNNTGCYITTKKIDKVPFQSDHKISPERRGNRKTEMRKFYTCAMGPSGAWVILTGRPEEKEDKISAIYIGPSFKGETSSITKGGQRPIKNQCKQCRRQKNHLLVQNNLRKSDIGRATRPNKERV